VTAAVSGFARTEIVRPGAKAILATGGLPTHSTLALLHIHDSHKVYYGIYLYPIRSDIWRDFPARQMGNDADRCR
jgi:hypothetical protein